MVNSHPIKTTPPKTPQLIRSPVAGTPLMATFIPVVIAPYKMLIAMSKSESYPIAANRRIKLGVEYSVGFAVLMAGNSHFKMQHPRRGCGGGLTKSNKSLTL